MKKLIWALALAGANVYAADWKYVASGEQYVVSVDVTSIVNVGKYKKAWLLADYAEAQPLDDYQKSPYKSLKQLMYFDCATRQSTTIQVIYYQDALGSGKTQKSAAYKFDERDMTDVVPDSVGEVMLEFACKKQMKK